MKESPAQIVAKPYHWPHDGGLDTRCTALVVIDMQRDFLDPKGYLAFQGYDITRGRSILHKVQHLLHICRGKDLPVYHTREGHRSDLSSLSSRELYRSRLNPAGLGIGDPGPLGRLLIRGEPGHDFVDELYPLANEPIIDKPGKGAFANTDFELLLRNKGVKNLILCGVTTDVCVHTTMREANDRGFDCLLVEDCCAASEDHLHRAAIEMVQTEGGVFGAVSNLITIVDFLKAI